MKKSTSPISAYTNALGTRPPLHVVVGLYDLVVVHILRAASAADRRDYEQQFNEAMRAAQILNGLSGCLDMKRGGTVAASLRDLYQSVVSALLRSVGKKQATLANLRLAEAVRLTRNAWAEIAKLPLSVKPLEITRLGGNDNQNEPVSSDATITIPSSLILTATAPAKSAPLSATRVTDISARQPRGLRARNNPL